MNQTNFITPRSLALHDGAFHADDVAACALLLLCDCIDRNKIIRSRNPSLIADCEYVCDVGGTYDPENKRFDHHQISYQGPLSSAGMILLYLTNTKQLSQEEADLFNNSLIKGIDAHDNGKDPQIPGYCSFSNIISNFTPIHYDASDDEYSQAFFSAVQFTLQHLKRLQTRFRYTKECRKIVAEAMAPQNVYLFFDKPIPWMEMFFSLGGNSHPAKFVIMPTADHWKLRCIPPSQTQKMQMRHPLPAEWAGLLEEELQKISGISGAIFCHKSRFISVWKTKEDALKALTLTLQAKGVAP